MIEDTLLAIWSCYMNKRKRIRKEADRFTLPTSGWLSYMGEQGQKEGKRKAPPALSALQCSRRYCGWWWASMTYAPMTFSSEHELFHLTQLHAFLLLLLQSSLSSYYITTKQVGKSFIFESCFRWNSDTMNKMWCNLSYNSASEASLNSLFHPGENKHCKKKTKHTCFCDE